MHTHGAGHHAATGYDDGEQHDGSCVTTTQKIMEALEDVNQPTRFVLAVVSDVSKIATTLPNGTTTALSLNPAVFEDATSTTVADFGGGLVEGE
jgi:hypothetical protein